jgi:hypothetical protein
MVNHPGGNLGDITEYLYEFLSDNPKVVARRETLDDLLKLFK